MTNNPLISVIILTYNTKDLTYQCLNKLKECIDESKIPTETIVVENGTDGTGHMIKKTFPWIKLIEPSENTGFARGNNLGIKEANKKTKYYLFLNTDAFLEKNTIKNSLEFFSTHPECDVMGCKLKFEDGRMQPSAGFLPRPGNTALWMLGLDFLSDSPIHPKQATFFSNAKRVEWIMGAFLFMKADVVKKTQGFDENFFMYMEEVEWCKRINEAGFKIFYTPEFEITHLDKASSGFDVKKPLTREIQGLYYFLKRYYPKSIFIMKMIIRLGVMGRFLAFSLLGNKYKASIYWDILKLI